VYRVLCGTVNPDDEARKKVPILYPETWPIPNKDRIWDEHKQDYVDIGVIDRTINVGGVATPKYKKLTTFVKRNNGYITCSGGIIGDEEIYEFFELTDHNVSKPKRDESKVGVIERIDIVGDSKKRVKSRNVKLDALKYFDGMTVGEMKEFAASMNWDENMDIAILQDKIGDMAENNPESFKKAVESKEKDNKAIIRRAIDAGVIKYDVAQHKVTLNGQTLMSLTRVEGVDYLTQAADWIATAKNGDKTLATIKKLMDKPKADNQPE
jgi:hypothetical protein